MDFCKVLLLWREKRGGEKRGTVSKKRKAGGKLERRSRRIEQSGRSIREEIEGEWRRTEGEKIEARRRRIEEK
jgi:hypothetical protein